MTYIAPTNGWKEQTYYVAEVSFNEEDFKHVVILYVGFLDKEGNPGNYSLGFKADYRDNETRSTGEYKYIKAVREINMSVPDI